MDSRPIVQPAQNSGEEMMRRPTSPRRTSLRPWQLTVGFTIVALLIGLAAVMVRGREQADLGDISGADPTNAALVAAGRQIYDTRCASCHGAYLEGQPGWQQPGPNGVLIATPLDEAGPSPQRTDQWLFAIVKDGGQPVAPPGTTSGMPAFGGLDDEQIWAVLSYIKSTWPQDIRDAQPR
jgi:mono/diheme cytochrome c family protein